MLRPSSAPTCSQTAATAAAVVTPAQAATTASPACVHVQQVGDSQEWCLAFKPHSAFDGLPENPPRPPLPTDMAYCNCATQPCSPAVGQPLASGEQGCDASQMPCQVQLVLLNVQIPAKHTQDTTGTTSWAMAPTSTGWALSQSLHLAPLRLLPTLPPATCTAAWLWTTAANLQFAGGKRQCQLSSLPPTMLQLSGSSVVARVCSKPQPHIAMLCSQNWGGQLGTGNGDGSSAPTPVTGEHSRFMSLCAGRTHTCGVLAGSKRVACFGEVLGCDCMVNNGTSVPAWGGGVAAAVANLALKGQQGYAHPSSVSWLRSFPALLLVITQQARPSLH